ncbi:small, acid-soluble spore protein, alpha/beta type [Terrisporobacter sp.]|uniref:small, acid-soluble spore protein, alpha/beta type n=1 Tax=Terrisporobacter sp. TaxID=1965305 RepID=UPI002624C860|nr:small, acid-soluble spore protein, alpha/beta type [Terrisporobacter sp.]
MNNNKLTKEFIYKCEKQRKKNEKRVKPLTNDDIMKYEIAQELGLLDKVDEKGWAGLTAKEAGRIGGILTSRKKQLKKKAEEEDKKDESV